MFARLRLACAHLLVLCAVISGCAAASVTLGRAPVRWQLPGFPALPERLLLPGEHSPISLTLRGIPPDAAGRGPHRPARAVRAIVLSPHEITLLAGGRVTRSIRFAQQAVDLSVVARAVADPAWIRSPAPGVIVLGVALIVEGRLAVTVRPPAVRMLVLADRPGVLLGVHRATLRIESATVESMRPRYDGTYRPFVLAEAGSRLLITHSVLAGLGWNYDDSYGVSWKNGSTGGATGSVFTGNYFGVYTGGVAGVTFTGNVVAGSYSYGLDPHSFSSRLTITGNRVTGNGRHGIILADHVTDSTVAGNTVRGNAANGIMLYGGSTGDVIERNTVTGNRGDGIVCDGAPGNRVIGNLVHGNRIGVHISATAPRTVELAGNVLTGNAMNAEGIATPAGNVVASDMRLGWDAEWLIIIWVLGTVLLTVTLMSLTSCLLG